MFPRLTQRAGTLAGIGLVIAIMIALVSFSVPLYRLFCAATGAGGTTQRVASDTATIGTRMITVSFNTDVAPGLPWSFEPVQRSVRVHLGEQVPVFFTATNRSGRDIVGHATFNVTPDKVGLYFKKVQCFCFAEERLAAHATVQLPVQFFVDPAIATDPSTAEVTTITLSYEFFESRRPAAAQDLARFAAAPGPADAAHGQAVFAARCAACHALDHAMVGPALGGVIGRTAGTARGYPYSPALKRSGLIWTPAALTAWLANPQSSVPGAMMPFALADPADRRDVIAYLGKATGSTPALANLAPR